MRGRVSYHLFPGAAVLVELAARGLHLSFQADVKYLRTAKDARHRLEITVADRYAADNCRAMPVYPDPSFQAIPGPFAADLYHEGRVVQIVLPATGDQYP